MGKRYFFGWDNIKWAIREVVSLYSDKRSLFSKKRIESSIAFLIAQGGKIYFLIERVGEMTTSEVISWSAVEFIIAGYTVNQIQKEKKNESKVKEGNDENTSSEIR